MEVKHDASPFMGVMMRVGSVYRIKIRRREVLQGPKVASAIMVARWTADAVMVLDKGKQTSLGSKQKIWTSNTTLGTFTGITMRVRCDHCIKIRSREAPQDSKSKGHRDCMLDCSGHRDQSQVTRHPKDENRKRGGQTRR